MALEGRRAVRPNGRSRDLRCRDRGSGSHGSNRCHSEGRATRSTVLRTMADVASDPVAGFAHASAGLGSTRPVTAHPEWVYGDACRVAGVSRYNAEAIHAANSWAAR